MPSVTALIVFASFFALAGRASQSEPAAGASGTTTGSTEPTAQTSPAPSGVVASTSSTASGAAKTSTSQGGSQMPTAPPTPPAYHGPATTNDNVSEPPKKGDEVAVIDTNMGQIVFKFFPDKAPVTVANFKALANAHFYDGTKFHRVVPGFMIQGGDPNTKSDDRGSYGMGGPGYNIPDEFSDIKHVRGIVSMAHTSAPNSGGSQFFIMVAPAPFLDGQYSAFGFVVKGMDVVDRIVNLPNSGSPNNAVLPGNDAVMKTVRIEKWPVS